MNRRKFLERATTGTLGALALTPDTLFANTPKYGGTATCGMSFLMQTPDPHRYIGTWARQCMAPCWEGLTTPTPMGERFKLLTEHGPDAAIPQVKPMLADSWEIDNDGKRYVFHLKKGVKFHNGKELDAEDVKWNWERIRNPAHLSGSRKFLTLFLDTIETPDKHTIVANLSQPYGGFLMANTWCFCSILPKDTIPEGAIWGFTPTFTPPTAAPPGTGPFVMAEYQQLHQAVFERFPDYRIKGRPYLDKLIYKVMSEDTPRTLAVRAKNVDYIWSAESNWLAKQIKGKALNTIHHLSDENLNLLPVIGNSTSTFYLNGNPDYDTPFHDERVRQALDYCIDRETLAKALYGDLGIPMYQGYNPQVSSWGFTDIKGRKRDIAKAKALLAEAGYPNGIDIEFLITPTSGKNDLRAQIVQQMAKPAGFRLHINSQVGTQYWSNLRQYTYQIMIWSVYHEDPMNFYYNYMHTDPVSPYNGRSQVLGVQDPEMDALLDEVATNSDLKQRKTTFKKVVQRAIDKAYFLPTTVPIGAPVWSDRLQNFNPLNFYQPEHAFNEAWVESEMHLDPKVYDRRDILKWIGATGVAAFSADTSPLWGETPKRGGTLNVGTTFLMTTPDPHRYTGFYARQAFSMAWEGLLTPTSLAERYRLLEEHGPDASIPEVKPMLADSWEIDKDGSRYIFHLKKGVKFHTGKEFDSEDVKWSWLRIKDPVTQSGTRKFLTLFLDTIETPDRHTVVANLTQPYGAFLMANTWCYTPLLPKDCIPPKTIWGETPTFTPATPAPPGTGPFRVTNFQQNYQAIFERFDNYRISGLPYLDKIVLKVMIQDGPRTMALRAGNIDCSYRVDEGWLATKLQDAPINKPIHLKDEKLILWPAVFPITYAIGLNSHPEKDTPFKDERVRQALAYCIDQEAIAKALYGKLGIPMHQAYNPDISAWGYRDIKNRKPDIPKAKALLKEAGYPNGLDIEFLITPVWGKNDLRAQIIQQMTKPAGFRIKINTQMGVQVVARARTYAYQMMTVAIGGEDPMNYYYNHLRTDPAPPSNGHSPRLGLKDPVLDHLLDLVSREPDHQQRKHIFKKIVQHAHDKAYLIYNNQAITAFTWSDKLQNFNPWDYFQAEQAFAQTWLKDA